mmetsp:Transcript_133758/g.198897  ORF Transcript_133758/g.198897 Transcript_133758/m.198897 type:complete len:297 (+) Transcript_133758:237-1127(+)
MEDRAATIPDLTVLGEGLPCPVSIFGVFDGHGGSTSSTFVTSTFPRILAPKLKNETVATINTCMPQKLQEALAETDNQLSQISKALTDGTTATVCCLTNNKLFTANIGDSRAILSRAFTAIDLSKDHKPDDPVEKARIVAAGGVVKTQDCARVYYPNGSGGLAMSRALGDEFYKDKKRGTLVTGTADITEHALYKEDQFIIIGSDGLWDVMSSTEVVDFIHRLRYISPKIDVNYLAQALVYEASSKKSGDNITVIVIELLNDIPQNAKVTEVAGGANPAAVVEDPNKAKSEVQKKE